MNKTLRWLLLPVACVAAWYVALFVGIVLLSVAQAFCPSNEMVSGMCIAPWYRPVETGIFCLSTALSALFVVTTAYFVAPTARVLVAWLAFGTGCIVALYFVLSTSAWPVFASAVAAGLVEVLLLSRCVVSLVRGGSARPL